jgi:ferredoxin--NADP+ reductase
MELRRPATIELAPGPKPLLGGVPLPSPPRPRPALVPNATLADREDVTQDIARLVVRPDGPIPAFEPGQYFSLGLNLQTGPVLRPYSTASARGATDGLEFLVRRVSVGALTPSLWNVAIGDRIWIGPPKGLFALRSGDRRTHLLISAGTGIAPFISMLPELVGPSAAAVPRVVVAHGVSHMPELAYRVRLELLAAEYPKFIYAPTVSRPNSPENAGWSGLVGRVERVLPSLWSELGMTADSTVAYLCGNPDMVAASREVLAGLGMSESAILHENYWAPPSAPTSMARAAAE